jgi:hypothetical protein
MVVDRRAVEEDTLEYDYSEMVLYERSEEENCSNRHSVPSYFWDWLLFPVAIDDLVTKLEDLSDKLGAINSKLSAVDFDQIPDGSGLNFGLILQANYEWLAAEDVSTGGALVPFNRLLDVMETKLEAAVN